MGGRGSVELGSPLPDVVKAWATTLTAQRVIDWGGAAFHVEGVRVVEPPSFASGYARLRTTTPVVLKGSGRDVEGRRVTRQAWLLPTDSEFPVYFTGNLRRKAETLGLDPEVSLERITWIGAKRSFAVGDGLKVGAPIEVELRGAPETLQAVWSWGLGQANSAGFGWVSA
ncbi:MAG: CRISPR-associated endoribonuclease Cas6 [Pseudonocardiaceae bacterium]